MNLITFNELEIVEDLKIFINLPKELHHYIHEYIKHHVYHCRYDYDLDWYDIIATIGKHYRWVVLVNFLNKHLTEKTTLLTQELNCRINLGHSHTCVEFITCDERLSIGFSYDYYTRKHVLHQETLGERIPFWVDHWVDSKKATEFIMDKLNEYRFSDKYNPGVMYKILDEITDWYYIGDANYDGDDEWHVYYPDDRFDVSDDDDD